MSVTDSSPHVEEPALGAERNAVRVTMLVRNPGVYDTRVRKEAVTLKAAGFKVCVLATMAPGMDATDIIDGVEFRRLPVAVRSPTVFASKYRTRAERRRDIYLLRQTALKDGRTHATTLYLNRRARSRRWHGATTSTFGGAARVAERPVLSSLLRGRRNIGLKATQLRLRARVLILRAVGKLQRTIFRIRSKGTAASWRLRRRTLLGLGALWYHTDYWRSVHDALRTEAPNVVHAHDLNTLFAGWKYARKYHAVLIYDSHELEMHRNTTWTRSKRLVSSAIERICIKRAHVITVSEGIADELAKEYGIVRPTVVLNSPRLSDVGSTSVDIRSQITAGPDDSLIIYTGKLAHGRGLDVLVHALAFLPPSFHVVILGPRTPSPDDALQSLASELGVASRVHLLAPLPPSEVPTAIRSGDVFVNPAQNVCRSYDLALPNKLFDAVFARLPIAVGNLVEMRRFVNEHQIGLVFDETDPASIARTLLAILNERPPGLLDAKKVQQLEWEVSWERQEKKLLDLYERITSDGVSLDSRL